MDIGHCNISPRYASGYALSLQRGWGNNVTKMNIWILLYSMYSKGVVTALVCRWIRFLELKSNNYENANTRRNLLCRLFVKCIIYINVNYFCVNKMSRYVCVRVTVFKWNIFNPPDNRENRNSLQIYTLFSWCGYDWNNYKQILFITS